MATTRRQTNPVRTLAIFVLVVIGMYVVMGANSAWTPKLGLDLEGGTTVTLTAANTTGEGAVSPESLEQARQIMENRVNGMGVTESEVTTSGDNQIVVAAPNVDEAELRETVGQTAQLYFRKVYCYGTCSTTSSTGTDDGATSDEDLQAIIDELEQSGELDDEGDDETAGDEAEAADEAESADETTANPGPPLPGFPTPVPSPRPTTPTPEEETLDDLLAWEPDERDKSDLENWDCTDNSFPNVPDRGLIACDDYGYPYLLGPALLSGEMLDDAAAVVPQNSMAWVVTLDFNDQGATDFEKITANLATQTSPQNQFAIVLDKRVISAPSVAKAIPGGNAEISGNFTQKSASSLANVLDYGALPLSFTIETVQTVSAKLGGDQLGAGITAGLIGLGLVVVYSVIYYRGLSVLMVASLGIAGLMTWAAVSILGWGMGYALNLPGIAGAIVAIGVTADSFIIYFERIRDEAREGRSLRTAIEAGWVRSRKTILVADSVSLLSAVVLWILSIGSVKGFAFTLGLTTLIDIAIVFFFTKPLMTIFGRTKFFGEGRRFSGFEAEHLGVKKAALAGVAVKGGVR
ncbi:MAG: protein translocase subunit SecD [Propionibacteriaceae bacterium]|jgi:preprotein translocase subunit SecD|nr:protein translocase subunit SecD [Propionibacteriaceae bacterium]